MSNVEVGAVVVVEVWPWDGRTVNLRVTEARNGMVWGRVEDDKTKPYDAGMALVVNAEKVR